MPVRCSRRGPGQQLVRDMVCAGVLSSVALACARSEHTASPTDGAHPDRRGINLDILRHRAAMGDVEEVRTELQHRLARTPTTKVDLERDALRRLEIELALRQGDEKAALVQLETLDAIRSKRAGADGRAQAEAYLLHATVLFRRGRFADARQHDKQALELLTEPGSAVLRGNAFRALARDDLALRTPMHALVVIRQALALHRPRSDDPPWSRTTEELLTDLLLATEILVALEEAEEAVITAGAAYDAALDVFGPDTLQHAAALAATGQAVLALGDTEAARSVGADARTILRGLQAKQRNQALPVNESLFATLERLFDRLPAPTSTNDRSTDEQAILPE